MRQSLGKKTIHLLRRSLRPVWLACVVVASCPPAWAHGVAVACKGKADIRCQAAFADGTSMAGATVRVLSYKDVVVWTGKVDAKGQVAFRRPAGAFYVQFLGADGHLQEVDHAQIKP